MWIPWLLPLLFPLFAEDPASDVLDVAAEYQQKSLQVNQAEEQKRKIMAEVYALEKETQKILYRKTDLDERKAKLDYDLNQSSQQIIVLEEQLKAMIPDLVQTLRLSEGLDRMPWLFTMVTSQSAIEIEELQEVTQAMGDLHAQRLAEMALARNRLSEERKKLTETAQKILRLKMEISKQEKQVVAFEKQKKGILKKVEALLSQEKLALQKLYQQGKTLTQSQELKDLEILFDRGFFDRKGQLPRPVVGRLSQPYGLNKALSFDRVKLLHKGHFYQTHDKVEVRAVAAGRVAHVGRLAGYGDVIVLDHGNHYYTTYANLKASTLKRDQQVKPGQIIGMTGHSHLQLGIGLYFEVRHFSQPQDPIDWLIPEEGQLASLQQ